MSENPPASGGEPVADERSSGTAPAAPVSGVPRDESSTSFQALFRRMGGLSGLAVASLLLPPLGGFALLYFREPISLWLQSHPTMGLWLYIAGFVIFAGLALLPTYAQAVIGGFAFHFSFGFPAALAGFLGAALLGYCVARVVGGNRAMEVIHEHPKWQAVRDALLGGGFWKTLAVVSLVRLPPNSPFAATNLVMAAMGSHVVAYGLGTLLGMAPRTAAAVYIGAQLKALDDADAPGWYFWAGLGAMLLALGVIGSLMNNAIQSATRTIARSNAAA